MNTSRRIYSYKFKFFLTFFIVASVILTALFFLLQIVIGDIIFSKSEDIFKETMYQISERLNANIKTVGDVFDSVAHDTRINNYLSEIMSDRYYYLMNKAKTTREVLKLIDPTFVENVYIFLPGAKPVNCFYSEAYMETPEKYLECMNSTDYSSVNGKWEVVSTQPYRIRRTQVITRGANVLGILAIDFNSALFDDIINKDGTRIGGIFLVSDSDRILYTAEPLAIGTALSHNLRGSDQRLTAIKLSHYSWQVVGALPVEAIDEEMRNIRGIFTFVLIIVLIAILIIPITVTISIVKPMNKIIEGISKIKGGDLQTYIDNKSGDEFELITDNFNSMVQRITGLIDTNVRQRKDYTELQFDSLKSRLNPHFLYNSLDMIKWMLVIEGKNDIGDIIVSLSDILRYSITKEDSYVTIKEDFAQLENYLSIQSLRFGSKLKYTIFCEEDLLDFQIPKLFLQPLVENAFKHGFTTITHNSRLEVSAALQGEHIVFSVKDNGCGIAADRLKFLNRNNNTSESVVAHSGYGVELVRSIAKHTYGADATLTICSEQDEGTEVAVKIRKTQFKVGNLQHEHNIG